MVFKKGNIPWNKGKKGVQLSTRKGKFGKKHSEETRKLMSLAQKGSKNHFFGKHHNEKTKKIISIAQKGHIMPDHVKKIIAESSRNRIWTEKSRKKISVSKLGKPRPQHVRDALLHASIGRIPSIETRKKMSLAGKGRKKSEEWKQKMKELRKNWKIPFKDTKPERMMQIALALNSIKFEKHKRIDFNNDYHHIDIFIEPNICIEIDGIHWHLKPENMKRDLYINQELNLRGYNVLRIRDKDILQNAQNCALNVINLIKQLQYAYLSVILSDN